MKQLSYCIALFLLFMTCTLFAQQNEAEQNKQKVIIHTKSGEGYYGILKEQNHTSVIIITKDGEFTISKNKIERIEKIEYRGKYAFPNSHDTRYFFGPTGIPLEKGKGYYQNILVTTNFVNYGLSKNFSIGGGVEFTSLISRQPVWFLTPKFGFKLADKLHLGVGAFVIGFATESISALGFSSITYGGSDSNISLGVGYGRLGGDWAKNPAYMIAGIHRVKKGLSLISENYVYTRKNIFEDGYKTQYIGIQGLRILSKKNAFDVGVIVLSEFSASLIPALPYVGYARKFGKGRK